MRFPSIISQWAISLAVAVALLGAPLLPAVASATADDSVHTAHGSAGVASAAAAAMHADHGMTTKAAEAADGNPSSGCYQHDQCSGKCCATCAQCFTVTFVLPVASVRSHAVQSPIVLRLHDRLVAAVHNRPPAA
jgi:hypothetical protein